MQERGVVAPEATPVSGDEAQLAEATWEYRGAVTEDAEPAPGVRTVGAAFMVTPENKVAGDRLYYHCKFTAIDDQGRSWTVANSYTDLPEDVVQADGTGCPGPTGLEPMPIGEATQVVAAFEVPEDAVSSLRFEVEVATHKPEVTYDQSTEDALAELEEIAADPEEFDPDYEENPPKPEALSFPYREAEN